MALNTHTLKGLGGADIINRLCEIQVITNEQSVFRRWAGKVFQILARGSTVKTVLKGDDVGPNRIQQRTLGGDSEPGSSGIHDCS